MAVVSESALYQGSFSPAYVSSSGYYGYVRPCPIADYENASSIVQQQQLGRVVGGGGGGYQANGQTTSNGVGAMNAVYQQQQQLQQFACFNGAAMETDDDYFRGQANQRDCCRVFSDDFSQSSVNRKRGFEHATYHNNAETNPFKRIRQGRSEFELTVGIFLLKNFIIVS